MRAFPLVFIGLSMAFGVTTGARAAPCPVPGSLFVAKRSLTPFPSR